MTTTRANKSTDKGQVHLEHYQIKQIVWSLQWTHASTAEGSVDTPHEEGVQPTPATQQKVTGKDGRELPEDTDDSKTFEQRLQEWIRECRKQRIQKQVSESSEQEYKDVNRFIHHFGITHYVNGIELGALSYKMVSEEKYERSCGLVLHSALALRLQ